MIQLQDRIYNEIVEKTVTEPEEFEVLNGLNYMECVIKETLRLYPAVTFIARRSEGELKLKDDRILPKNCDIIIHMFGIHRNEKCWPEPDKFDPDRFLPENSVGRHRGAFVPFSIGPRQCMGVYKFI